MSNHDLSYEYIAKQIRINLERLLDGETEGIKVKGEMRLTMLAERLEQAACGESMETIAAVRKSQDEINRGHIVWDEADEDVPPTDGSGWEPK